MRLLQRPAKRPQPAEADRPDVRAKRLAFLMWATTVDPKRLACVDESGANRSMGRSHAWVLRGMELVDPRPRNRGDNLTMIGAVPLTSVSRRRAGPSPKRGARAGGPSKRVQESERGIPQTP